MKLLAPLLLVTAVLSSHAQLPLAPPKSALTAPAPAKLTSRDIRVQPFVQEYKEVKFKENTRNLPSEFLVTTTDKIHFHGKRRTDGTVSVRGQDVGNFGQLALLPPGDRSGTIALKKAFGLVLFFAVLELPDDALSSKDLKLKEGKSYTWTINTENGTTTLRVLGPDGAEMVSSSAPKDTVLGLGFAVTARSPGNEVDMTVTY